MIEYPVLQVIIAVVSHTHLFKYKIFILHIMKIIVYIYNGRTSIISYKNNVLLVIVLPT